MPCPSSIYHLRGKTGEYAEWDGGSGGAGRVEVVSTMSEMTHVLPRNKLYLISKEDLIACHKEAYKTDPDL